MKSHEFVLFAPKQHECGMDAIVAETREDFFRHAAACGDDVPVPEMYGFCFFDPESEGPNYGKLVFLRANLDRAVVVHEVVHAALLFVQHVVMQSAEVLAMSEEEKGEYYHEACAQVSEALFVQVAQAFFARERPAPALKPEAAELTLKAS